MQHEQKTESRTGKIALTLCNIILLLAVIFFAARYSANVQAEQEQTTLDTFCTTVETMKRSWIFPVEYAGAEIGLITAAGTRRAICPGCRC